MAIGLMAYPAGSFYQAVQSVVYGTVTEVSLGDFSTAFDSSGQVVGTSIFIEVSDKALTAGSDGASIGACLTESDNKMMLRLRATSSGGWTKLAAPAVGVIYEQAMKAMYLGARVKIVFQASDSSVQSATKWCQVFAASVDQVNFLSSTTESWGYPIATGG